MNIRLIQPDGTLDVSDSRFVSDEFAFGKWKHFLLDEDDIIVSSSGSIGKRAWVRKQDLPLMLNTSVIRFRPKDESVIDKRFLWHYLGSNHFLEQIHRMKTGTAQVNFGPSHLKKVNISYSSVDEQKRIAAILDKADEIRINSEYSQQIREILISSVFLDTFGDPSSWTASDSTTLGDLCIKVKQAKPIEIFSDEFTYIDIASIDGSLGAITEPKSVQASDAPSRARQILQTGDILISTVRPYLRGTAVIEADYDNAIGSTGFCVLRPSDNSHSSFIYAFSRLDWFNEQLMGVATGASYPAVKKRDVEDLRVPIIEEGVLSIFNDTIAVIDELFSTNNPTVRRAIELSRSLCGELLDQTTI